MIPPFPPGAPAVSPDAAPTDTLPPGAPEPEALPATVIMGTPARATAPPGATMVMGSSPRNPATDATFKSVPPAPTVRAPMPAPVVTEKVPLPVAAAAASAAASAQEPTRKASVPAAIPPRARVPARGTPRVSATVILAIAGVLTVAAVGLGMAALYRRLSAPRAATPEVAAPTEPATPEQRPAPAPAAPAPAAAPAEGTLHVTSNPPGAAVSVDGQPRGVTPIDVTGLGLGDHAVKVELKGYQPRTENVTLSAGGARAELDLPLARVAPTTGLADILSVPFGAVVTVDGAAVGYTPLMSWKLKQGAHKVEVTKDGHEPWSGTVTVTPGKRTRLDVAAEAPTPPLPSPPSRPWTRPRSTRWRRWTPGPTSSAGNGPRLPSSGPASGSRWAAASSSTRTAR